MPLNPSYRGFIYLIGSRQFNWYKIGRTRYLDIRIRDLGILLPFKVEKYATWKAVDPVDAERHMHILYASNRLNGEWFSFSPDVIHAIVSTEPPFDGIRVFPSSDSEVPMLPKVKNHNRASVEERYNRRLARKAFGMAVMEFIGSRGMEASKQNKMFAARVLHESDPKSWRLVKAWNPCVNLLASPNAETNDDSPAV